jgi:hypothetical protein
MHLYLFQDRDTEIFAISRDATGANVPAIDEETRWMLRDTIQTTSLLDGSDLGQFEAAMREMDERGFYIFRGQYLRVYPNGGDEYASFGDLEADVNPARRRRYGTH